MVKKNEIVPTGEKARVVNSPAPEDMKPTVTASNEAVMYDISQPVFQMSKRSSGRIEIPLYEDVPKVKGLFKNLEHPGHSIRIPFRAWKGPIRYFTLSEGETIEIPVSLCDHLNNNCAYVEKKWQTQSGNTVTRPIFSSGSAQSTNVTKEIKSYRHRYQFLISHNIDWRPRAVQ